jgi:hypothetical protein
MSPLTAHWLRIAPVRRNEQTGPGRDVYFKKKLESMLTIHMTGVCVGDLRLFPAGGL